MRKQGRTYLPTRYVFSSYFSHVASLCTVQYKYISIYGPQARWIFKYMRNEGKMRNGCETDKVITDKISKQTTANTTKRGQK